MTLNPTPITVGKYLVSPLARELSDGRYQSSVSIRTGHGRATHDRVLRFVPLFDSALDALRYAVVQGRDWVSQPQLR